MMRTTLTIDDDVARQIDDLRRREGLSLKGAINDLLRIGLRSRREAPPPRSYRVKTRPLKMRPGFDTAKLNQLVDELETRQALEENERRR